MSTPKSKKRIYTLNPQEYKGADGKKPYKAFKGYLKLRCPSLPQVMDMMRKANFRFDSSKGDVDVSGQELEISHHVLEAAKEFYEEVKLEHESGTLYESYDDLVHDADCWPLVNGVALMVMQGLKPSPN